MIEVFDFTIQNANQGELWIVNHIGDLNNQVVELSKKAQNENSGCMNIVNAFIVNPNDPALEKIALINSNQANKDKYINDESSDKTKKSYFKQNYINEEATPSNQFRGKYIEDEPSPTKLGDATGFNYPLDGTGKNKALEDDIKFSISNLFTDANNDTNFELAIGDIFKKFLDALAAGFRGLGHGFKDLIPYPTEVVNYKIASDLVNARDVLKTLSTLDDEEIKRVCDRYTLNSQTVGLPKAYEMLKVELIKMRK